MAKAEIAGGKREPLPEGAYPFVVVNAVMRELPDWKWKYAVLNWNENEEKKAERLAKTGKDYTPQPVEDFSELPPFKQNEWHFELKVRDGEHKGAWLPPVDLPMRWNPDKQWREKANWFKFCKVLVPELAKRADAEDLPDIHEELIGFGGLVDVEVTEKGYNKNVGYRKDPKVFGKRLDIEDMLAASGFVPVDEDSEVPF